jgi:hypothetical protein
MVWEGRSCQTYGKAGGGVVHDSVVWSGRGRRTPDAPTVATLVLGPNTTAGESEY